MTGRKQVLKQMRMVVYAYLVDEGSLLGTETHTVNVGHGFDLVEIQNEI